MRLGICTSPQGSAELLDLGFDYLEWAAFPLLADSKVMQSAVFAKVESTNLFFPGGISLWTGEFNAVEYAENLFLSLADSSIQTMVIGSGDQRKWKTDEESEEGLERFAELVMIMQGLPCAPTLAPESLNSRETNLGNDCGILAKALARNRCGYTADSYHLFCTWSDSGNTDEVLPDFLAGQIPHAPCHVHLANAERQFPQVGDQWIDAFLDRLNQVGYTGRISLECQVPSGTTVQDVARLKEWIRDWLNE
ncbi:MAG: sugar phosphate isomerase/epimerase [Fimbriimonadaceae bacterium]|jgi:hypothetical protein|nr:sugar phosphate isomerase/epimerase [Fimbriimonadaceae bacterium]